MTETLQKKYKEYISRESKYAHIKPTMTYQAWKNNYLKIHKDFTNAMD